MQRRTLIAAAVAALMPKPTPAEPLDASLFVFYEGCDAQGDPLPCLRADFGAVGDGVTDDSEAWQRASDHTFRVPAGTYRVTRGLDWRD